MLRSPLLEKRIILFSIRKQMIGRRAYSESVRSKKATSAFTREDAKASSRLDTQKESPGNSPKSDTTTETTSSLLSEAELVQRAYEVSAC